MSIEYERIAHERSARAHTSSLNNNLAFFLVGLVALAPLPLGSNRAIFWGINAIIVGLVACVYVVASARARQQLRYPLRKLGPNLWLAVALLLYLIVQILPLGGVLPQVTGYGLEKWDIVPPSISLAPNATVLMFLRIATYSVFYFLVVQVGGNDERRNWMLNALLAAVTIYGLIGIGALRMGDTLLGLQKWAYLGSATGTFINRNSFATFLAFGVIVAVSQLLGTLTASAPRSDQESIVRPNLLASSLQGVAACILVAAIIASQSRMGAFVTVLGSVVIVAMASARRTVRPHLLVLITAAVVVGALGAFWLYGEGLLDRLGSVERSSEDRTALYAQVLQMIGLRPWMGFGGGSFPLAFPLVHDWPVSADVVWDKAHNTYLALWAELGVVAGSLPILMVGITAVAIALALVRNRGSWRAQATALATIVVGAVHSLVDFSLEIQADTLLFLMLVGLGAASIGGPATKARLALSPAP